jgi:DNA-binding NarL/FixJ family response regulator
MGSNGREDRFVTPKKFAETCLDYALPILLLVGKPGHLRDALASLVQSNPSLGRVVCVDSGLLAVKATGELQPRLVIIANNLPETEVPELIRQIKHNRPETACLALAERAEQQRQALYAGADSILPAGIEAGRLLNAIKILL